MSRPRRCRRICREPAYESFVPQGIPCREEIVLTLDEYEVIRLVDLEKLTHEQCARQMDISRTTVTEIYESAREKLADSLVHGKILRIAGGNYRLCDGSALRYCQKACKKAGNEDMCRSRKHPAGIPLCTEKMCRSRKGENIMRIAVTYENGSIFQHFGHTEQFKLYDIEDGKVTAEEVVDTNGQGHGALSGFLAGAEVDALICGGIGGGAQMALAEAGIKLYGGVSGMADDAVKAYLAGNLNFNPNVQCNHHGHEHGHSCGEHHCGEDKHGCPGHEA
ncbi:MAG: DUF134 domain-containing protein [Lachnospiraceae bacterium]|nr:DUF134 domain-containing protein [Lachnospiraceae bacterium]